MWVLVHRCAWPFDVLVERPVAERDPAISVHAIALRYFAAADDLAAVAV